MKFVVSQNKFSFPTDSFYSQRPNVAFAKSKVTVTLYIEDEKVYFKEFEGPIVKGTKTSSNLF